MSCEGSAWQVSGADALQESRLLQEPGNLFILAFTRLALQTDMVELRNVSGNVHTASNVVLYLRDRLQGVGHCLVLLNVSNDIRSLLPLRKVDEMASLDGHVGISVFDEGEICEVDPEEWHTSRHGRVKCFAVLGKVLGRVHQPVEVFCGHGNSLIEQIPCPAQSMYWGRVQTRDDGRQCRKVV